MTTPDTTTKTATKWADVIDGWECCQNHGGPGCYPPRCGECTRDLADTLRALAAENAALRAELADANHTIAAYVAIQAVRDAEAWGLPKDHLLPHHYDILQKAGARMDSFTRAALDAKP
jgi:hypothetical protein